MTILRKRLSGRFVTIPNAALEDSRLSFKARGVLAYLLAKPDGWSVRATAIAADGPDGRDAIRSALRELEDLGYYRRQVVNGGGGRLVTITQVSDTPIDPDEDTPSTGDGFSGAGRTGVGSTGVGWPGPLVITQEQIPTTTPLSPPEGEETLPLDDDRVSGQTCDTGPVTATTERPKRRAVSDDDPDWSRFWSLYPRKTAKGAARTAWARAIGKVDPDVILGAVERFAGTVREVRYCPHPATWLNQERWADELDPAATGGTYEHGDGPARVMTADEWEQEGRRG